MAGRTTGIHISDIAGYGCARARSLAHAREKEMRNNDNAYQAIFNAAQIISMDARIADWLGNNDPKALVQLRGAIKAVQAEIDRSTALSALDERFDSITDITHLDPIQEHALLRLLDDVLDTLMLRGRSRLSMKLGADVAHALSKYRADVETEREVAAMAAASKKGRVLPNAT